MLILANCASLSVRKPGVGWQVVAGDILALTEYLLHRENTTCKYGLIDYSSCRQELKLCHDRWDVTIVAFCSEL